jgi:hypothetical protein
MLPFDISLRLSRFDSGSGNPEYWTYPLRVDRLIRLSWKNIVARCEFFSNKQAASVESMAVMWNILGLNSNWFRWQAADSHQLDDVEETPNNILPYRIKNQKLRTLLTFINMSRLSKFFLANCCCVLEWSDNKALVRSRRQEMGVHNMLIQIHHSRGSGDRPKSLLANEGNG